MQLKSKTYYELCIEINPVCADVLCDIIQSEFDCEGIITAEEKYKNLELVESSENILKAYITADSINFDEMQAFFKERRQDLINRGIFTENETGSWNIKINEIENTDWSKKWKENWKPSKISDRIVVCPSWEKYEAQNDEIIITLDPGNAFGTGEHATTRLCVSACGKYMPQNASIADIGTGSGILAICASKLGAKNLDAVDTDETVIDTAKINAAQNCTENIHFQCASSNALPSSSYDFVFANILHNVLADIMPDLKRIMKKGAYIVLSGILEGKEGVVLEAAKKNGLKIIEKIQQKEWLAYIAEKED